MTDEMLAVAGHFPDLPPTPKPSGGPVPCRIPRKYINGAIERGTWRMVKPVQCEPEEG